MKSAYLRQTIFACYASLCKRSLGKKTKSNRIFSIGTYGLQDDEKLSTQIKKWWQVQSTGTAAQQESISVTEKQQVTWGESGAGLIAPNDTSSLLDSRR